MDNLYYGLPFGIGLLLRNDSELERYFFELDEETQQALIKEDIRSSDDLRNCIERYRLKE
ncbi:MAG TPA: hypothetical protein VHO71_02495 [Caproiciproducens sp.]|nr:hypothetical protein [Caproiciproducens sp.]